jgi:hypothetical protein
MPRWAALLAIVLQGQSSEALILSLEEAQAMLTGRGELLKRKLPSGSANDSRICRINKTYNAFNRPNSQDTRGWRGTKRRRSGRTV